MITTAGQSTQLTVSYRKTARGPRYLATRRGQLNAEQVERLLAQARTLLEAKRDATTHLEVSATPNSDGNFVISVRGDGPVDTDGIELMLDALRAEAQA